MLTWDMLAPTLSRSELKEEIEIARREGVDLLRSVYAGALVRALTDCRQCEGACRLWFMGDSEAPSDVCPYFCSTEHRDELASLSILDR